MKGNFFAIWKESQAVLETSQNKSIMPLFTEIVNSEQFPVYRSKVWVQTCQVFRNLTGLLSPRF
jgi:hypothetical protein